ncbi:MAG TPA: hypothetical protein VD833_16870 [Vicinamibacterales bacterium]|nr:hypothetical protein [Vicinamibacterales bacterium]
MRCPGALAGTIACSIAVLIPVPCSGEERCLVGPVGPHDLAYLTACRPAAVSAAQREEVLQTLPSTGAVTTLEPKERAKLDTLASVLRFHARDDVYHVKVIDVPQAWAGLHGRAVLLISLPAVRLLHAEQLQALVAHEIAHEYWWDARETARHRSDRVRLRSLELLCDAVAALTLTALDIPAERLISALGAVHEFNRGRFGVAGNDADYPSLRRRQLIVKSYGYCRLPIAECRLN